ncbi:amidase signature domain-containing protein [Suillus plorans]|uniref:Amidase signature domain-containing protein n=1 Tax=Suillus plorans TaxID=116603 RepID=A0A9P7ABM6_9AGAM|nr:amidase signature domain-containing protein [Suillus plorans]KAG1785202.1 amidase signature domain-containing protein [Suillus plorans]
MGAKPPALFWGLLALGQFLHVSRQSGLTSGQFTSVDLIKAYFSRIEGVNLQVPMLRAVTNLSALQEAAILDYEELTYVPRSVLHGILVLVKDNVATVAFEGVAKRLREAGDIILGKENPSEWAHFRGNINSGWSGVL